MEEYLSYNDFEADVSDDDYVSDSDPEYEDPFADEPNFLNKDKEIETKITELEIKKGKPGEDILDEDDASEDSDGVSNSELEETFTDDEEEKKECVLNNTICNYKKENIKCFSKLGVISLLTFLVTYIKKGGLLLDGKRNFVYPDITEESYAIESIILNTHPLVLIENNNLINLNHEDVLLCLKKCLRVVVYDEKHYFTKSLQEDFPIFIENLFFDSISQKELDEIKEVKQRKGIIL